MSDQLVPFYPFCRKCKIWLKYLCYFATENFHVSKNAPQTEIEKDSAFKDFFTLDCIQKMLYPAQRQHENVSRVNGPLA